MLAPEEAPVVTSPVMTWSDSGSGVLAPKEAPVVMWSDSGSGVLAPAEAPVVKWSDCVSVVQSDVEDVPVMVWMLKYKIQGLIGSLPKIHLFHNTLAIIQLL